MNFSLTLVRKGITPFCYFFYMEVAVAQQICVSGISETTPATRFEISSNGTVTDLKTGLMWKRCAEGLSGAMCETGNYLTVNWSDALRGAQLSGFAGYSDWRLPNIKELRSIVEFSCTQPSINLNVFPNTPAFRFSSSTPFTSGSFNNADSAKRGIFFSTGSNAGGHRGNKDAIRLVRNR